MHETANKFADWRLGVRVVYPACSIACLYFLALVLTLTAYEQSTPEGVQMLDAGRAAFGSAISNPWMTSLHPAYQTNPPDNSASKDRTSPGKLFASLDRLAPQAHRMKHDAWFHFRPPYRILAKCLTILNRWCRCTRECYGIWPGREDGRRIRIETPGKQYLHDTS